jgi:1,4-alpha-glucan branching enzyme
MHGYLCLLLHAHLPFVRHPDHERFLEESWFYEAAIETYLPLLDMLNAWHQDGLPAKLTLTLSPTLCCMLRDPLLTARLTRRLTSLRTLCDSEVRRTHLDPPRRALAIHYRDRLEAGHRLWEQEGRDLVSAFARLQANDRVEIITCAATHALLPLFADHPPTLRAQMLTARDHYRDCFGRDPEGFWLPECAYAEPVESLLQDADFRWFALEAHGVGHAAPLPRYGVYAPIFTPEGLAAFGRDLESARQVWSRTEGYPGDPRYRDFYRDIGYDLDWDYVAPHVPSPNHRGFTGIKYHSITGPTDQKQIYRRDQAQAVVRAHAAHFLRARRDQVRRLAGRLGRPPVLFMPYDAELFGHWWYEGLEFLDAFVRGACEHPAELRVTTPRDYLREEPTHQVAAPAASSWGEHGYFHVWLNETNDWILPHLDAAQRRMTELADRFDAPSTLQQRALNQAARESMLAQASDWPFILRTGTSPDYARFRVEQHLQRFNTLHHQLLENAIHEPLLRQWELEDNVFPGMDYRHFRRCEADRVAQ